VTSVELNGAGRDKRQLREGEARQPELRLRSGEALGGWASRRGEQAAVLDQSGTCSARNTQAQCPPGRSQQGISSGKQRKRRRSVACHTGRFASDDTLRALLESVAGDSDASQGKQHSALPHCSDAAAADDSSASSDSDAGGATGKRYNSSKRAQCHSAQPSEAVVVFPMSGSQRGKARAGAKLKRKHKRQKVLSERK
jgi:hypothetical protein